MGKRSFLGGMRKTITGRSAWESRLLPFVRGIGVGSISAPVLLREETSCAKGKGRKRVLPFASAQSKKTVRIPKTPTTFIRHRRAGCMLSGLIQQPEHLRDIRLRKNRSQDTDRDRSRTCRLFRKWLLQDIQKRKSRSRCNRQRFYMP